MISQMRLGSIDSSRMGHFKDGDISLGDKGT